MLGTSEDPRLFSQLRSRRRKPMHRHKPSSSGRQPTYYLLHPPLPGGSDDSASEGARAFSRERTNITFEERPIEASEDDTDEDMRPPLPTPTRTVSSPRADTQHLIMDEEQGRP